MKEFIKRKLYGRKSLLHFFAKMNSISLGGLNYGNVDLRKNGEVSVLRNVLADTGTRKVVILDVGANQGQYARAVIDLFGARVRLLCFEPSPTAFQELDGVLGRTSGVQLFNFGFSNSVGERQLYAVSLGGSGSSLYPKSIPNSPYLYDENEKVQVCRLDDFCDEAGIQEIDLLKIDVEGSELDVIRGAQRMIAARRIKRIQFEFGTGNLGSRTFLSDFFEELGSLYRLHQILVDGLREIPEYSVSLEVFVTSNYLAVLR